MKWVMMIVMLNVVGYLCVVMKHRSEHERCDRCGKYYNTDTGVVRFYVDSSELICEHCYKKMES